MLLSLVDMREMSSAVYSNPFYFFDMVEEGLHRNILSLIIGSIDQKSWGGNSV